MSLAHVLQVVTGVAGLVSMSEQPLPSVIGNEFLLHFLTSFNGSSQNYVPMPDERGIWEKGAYHSVGHLCVAF